MSDEHELVHSEKVEMGWLRESDKQCDKDKRQARKSFRRIEKRFKQGLIRYFSRTRHLTKSANSSDHNLSARRTELLLKVLAQFVSTEVFSCASYIYS